ncbi:MAG: acyl-CoA thioesterase [Hyphomicrobiaceae bacterium]
MTVEIETYRNTIYPWQCDNMGHMNTQFYCGIFDAASFHLLSRLAHFSEIQARDQGWADVKITIEYKLETHSGALVYVKSRLTRLGSKAIEYHHELYNTETGALHATADVVTVLFDQVARKALPLDETMRERARALGVG